MKISYVAAPETRVSEAVNLAAFAWWSLLLLAHSSRLPGGGLFETNRSFAAMAARADERHWGAVTVCAALLTLTGLLSRRPAWRVLGLACAAGLWALVAALIAQGAPALPLPGVVLPRSTGVGAYGALSLASFACAILLSPYFVADLLTALGRALREPDRAWRGRVGPGRGGGP